MTVRFKLVYPVVFAVLGMIDLVQGFLAVQGFFTGDGTIAFFFVFCAAITIGAASQWSRGYFEFDLATCTIAIKRAFGSGRRFGGADGGLLFVDGGRVFCTTPGGARKRVPVTRFLARTEQWNAVVEQIKQAPVTGPAPL